MNRIVGIQYGLTKIYSVGCAGRYLGCLRFDTRLRRCRAETPILGEAAGTTGGIARVYKAGSCHANDNIPGWSDIGKGKGEVVVRVSTIEARIEKEP